MPDELLFTQGEELVEYLAGLEQQADYLVDHMPEDELVELPIDIDVCMLFPQLIPQLPRLELDRVTARRETLTGGGSVIKFRIPFSGSPAVFRHMPSKRTDTPPRGQLSDTVLVINVPMGVRDGKAIEAVFHGTVEQIEQWLESSAEDLSSSQAKLTHQVRGRIARRRARVIAELAVAEQVYGLFRREE